MRKILTIARYQLLRTVRSKRTIWLQVFMPIMLIFILGSALSETFENKDRDIASVTAGVWSSDMAAASMFHNPEGSSDRLTFETYNSRQELIDALEDREVDFGVIVPDGFTTQVADGQPVEWELYPGFDEEDSMIAKSYIESMLNRMNLARSAAMTLGAGVANIATIGDPNISYVESVRPDLSGKDYSAIEYYAAVMLVMFVLYAGMSTGLAFAAEKEDHTLERLYAAPIKPIHLVAGKMLGSGAVALGQSAVIILCTRLFYGVDWGDRYLLLLVASLLTVVASISLGVIVAAFAKSGKTIQLVFTLTIMVMTFISGGFNPNLSDSIERIGEFTLSYWASRSFVQLILDSSLSTILQHISWLGMIAILLFAGSALLGRKAVSHE